MIVLDPNGEKLNLMPLNVGPSHPATHGCLRFLTAMDGETIVASVEEIGYLHRGFEKMVERGTWQQVIPYTDRLNYCSAIMNNITNFSWNYSNCNYTGLYYANDTARDYSSNVNRSRFSPQAINLEELSRAVSLA